MDVSRVVFQFSGYGISCKFFSAKRGKRILKDLKNPQRDRALKGIKNATWDLTYARLWVSKVKEQNETNRLWIFGTLDKGLRAIARRLLVSDKDVTREMESFCVEMLERTKGKELADLYFDLESKQLAPPRAINKMNDKEFRKHVGLIERSLEEQILQPL